MTKKARVDAITRFIAGCKSDGTWSATQSSAILAEWDNLADTFAFYSIGNSVDLESLDTDADNLVNAIKFFDFTGLNPADYDPDTIADIVAGYEGGGGL